MILKSYLLLTLYFLVLNSVAVVDGMNMHDVNSIETFINNVRERAWSYYRAENATSSVNEKKGILKMVFHDLAEILKELNNMSADSRKVLSSGNLVSLISTLEKHTPKNGLILHSKLSDELRKIFNISEAINSYVEPLLQLGANDDQDVLKFCPTYADAGQEVKFEYEREIILKEFKEFVENLTARINDDKLFNFCGQTTSLNQAVFEYYHHLIATYLKEYVMLYYIDIIDARCLNLNAAPLLWMRQNETLSELKETIKLTKNLLATSKYSLYNCDLDYQTTIKPYYELKDMFKSIIIKESDLSTDGSCSHNCDLKSIKSQVNHKLCPRYHSCEYMGSTVESCQVRDAEDSYRYQWFKSDEYIYGFDYPHCNGTIQKQFNSYSWWPPFQMCDYCLCACQQSSSSSTTPAISYRAQVTNIDDDMVVVGVRFVEENNLIHVQIKERKLKPSSGSKASWKKIEDIRYNSATHEYHIKDSNSRFLLLKEEDDYGRSKVLHPDELIAPQGYVITGVRFRSTGVFGFNERWLNTGEIQLQIRITPFDYVKGVLVNKDKTCWIKKPYYFINKHRLPLENPDKPTRSPRNEIDSTPKDYVRFQVSDLKKDAGQPTVPFIDAQDVEGDPEFPLGGIAVVHRGQQGYGGFLAFKIYDLNLSKYFNESQSLS